MGTRAVGYVRISLDATGEGRGVARQREDVEALIARRTDWGLVADVFVENDTSASGRKKRPQFDAMMALVEAGDVDAVVAWSWDRLSRNRRDELRLIEACQRNAVTVALVRGSDMDMSTPAGRLFADMLATQARFEIEQKGDRQMRANKQRADEGRPSQGGRRAFGYEPDLMTVRESEAVHVRAAYTAVLAGASLNSIAKQWNEAGLTTVLGKPFTHNTVRLILMNPRNAGIRVHRGVEVGPAAWDALVDKPTFRATVSILSDPARRTNHVGGERRRLMTGVGLCGVCNDGKTTVLGGSKSAGQPVYRCSKAKHLFRLVDPVDQYVKSVVIERLSRPDANELLVDRNAPDLDALDDELTILQREMEALSGDLSLPLAVVKIRTIKIQDRIDEINELMEHRDRERVLGELVRAGQLGGEPGVRAVWNDYALDRKQAVLRELGTWTINKGKVGGNPHRNRYATAEDFRVSFDPHVV